MFSSSNINVPFTFIGVNKTHIKKNLANIVLYPWDLGRFELHKILHANEKYGIDMRTPSGRFIEICSIRESWRMLDRRLDLFAALSIDSLISELVEILLELPRASVGRGNIFDYPHVTDWCVPQLKSGAGFEARSNQYWKDNFLVHLWFIPNSDLSIILQRKGNLSESILQYYRKNIINVVEKQFATEQSSDQYGSVSSVVGIFLAFVIGSSVTLVVLKTLERRKCPKLTASNPISVMYVKDSS
ncbi:hypothetical protein L596_005856 [Steinernema carpocapsae]|uniref:Uncharacterized protein n=1 Tax=Steinernema carpocapsae TaxID=34508 RepID=A0A4U8V6E8_STECR|nr:hypothetical protein L596_005856 [Steinernema carpocapsae]